MLSVGKYRHLNQCSDNHGTMSVLAIDHRGPNEIQKNGQGPSTTEETVAFKRLVIRHLAPHCTAVLTDPDFGVPALTGGDLPSNAGFMAPLELTDYSRAVGDRGMDFLPDWDVAKLKRAGFSGAKLIMMFHPGSPNVQAKFDVVDSIVEQCEREQMPFFFEPICYSLDPAKPLSNAERRQVVVENARLFTRRGVDILKMEFPLDCIEEPDEAVWMDAARELDAVCTVPWALLSAGVGFDVFIKQAKVACAAGASGVIAGRAIWGDAVALKGQAQADWLASVGVERMSRITAICHGLGQSWKARHTAPDVSPRWYA